MEYIFCFNVHNIEMYNSIFILNRLVSIRLFGFYMYRFKNQLQVTLLVIIGHDDIEILIVYIKKIYN